MDNRTTSAWLSYAAFNNLWKTLVSQKKARKLKVDKNAIWNELLSATSSQPEAKIAARSADTSASSSVTGNPKQRAVAKSASVKSAKPRARARESKPKAAAPAPGRVVVKRSAAKKRGSRVRKTA